MTDREEREKVIEVLKNMLDWMEAANMISSKPERIEAVKYAIASIETDLKYDLLYEETSGQADKPTTKDYLGVDYLGVDCISRKAVQTRLKEIINEMETIFAYIREREVNDSVCGLCEYDCDHGLDGFANECPGFEKDDCFKLNEKYRAEWLDISNLPSVTSQLSSGTRKNSEKFEKGTTKKNLAVDCISRQALIDDLGFLYDENGCVQDNKSRRTMEVIMGQSPIQINQEPRKGHWIPIYQGDEIIDYRCSECEFGNTFGKGTIGMNFCPRCGSYNGSDNREVEK